MKPVTEFTQKDNELIQLAYADLMECVRKRCSVASQLELVQKAFEFANAAHNGVRRRSGEPYMLHPIAVAKIVVHEIGLGHKSICAALLHDVVEDTDFTVEDIEKNFGPKIALLVDGLTKIKSVLDYEDTQKEHTQSLQAENFRRILLTLNDDARVTGVNCIIDGNVDYAGAVSNVFVRGGCVFNLTYSAVDAGASVAGGEGNISEDPLFKNRAADNYQLAADSPCVNTGTNADWMATAVDLRGKPRIAEGIVDMGAYERQNTGLLMLVR